MLACYTRVVLAFNHECILRVAMRADALFEARRARFFGNLEAVLAVLDVLGRTIAAAGFTCHLPLPFHE